MNDVLGWKELTTEEKAIVILAILIVILAIWAF